MMVQLAGKLIVHSKDGKRTNMNLYSDEIYLEEMTPPHEDGDSIFVEMKFRLRLPKKEKSRLFG